MPVKQAIVVRQHASMAPVDAQAAECHHQLPFLLPYAVGTARRQDGCAQPFRHHPEFSHRPATWRRHRLFQQRVFRNFQSISQQNTYTHTRENAELGFERV